MSTQNAKTPELDPSLSPQTPVVTPDEPIDAEEVKKELKPLPLIIGGLLLLVVVAGVAFYMGMQSAPQTSYVPPMVTPQPVVSPSPVSQSSSSATAGLSTYNNTLYKYSFSYPNDWKVTAENYDTPATPTSEFVQIFNPDDKPEERFFSGMTIEYIGMLPQDLSTLEKVTINGNTLYKVESTHGALYYILLPDTDQLLRISGVSEGNSQETEILNSFKMSQL